MAEKCEIYTCNRQMPPNARIRQAADGSKVQFFTEDECHTEQSNWIRFEIRWPEGIARIVRMDIRDPGLAVKLREAGSFVSGAAGGEMDQRLQSIHERILRSRNVLIMSAPPECADRLDAFARALAPQTNGFSLCDSTLRDPQGRVCVDQDGTFDPEASWETPPSAIERKARSEARMRQHGIPVIDSLPPSEADEESQIRPPWEVARRASALVTVAARAEGLEQQRALQFLQAWGLWEAASPREQAFLMNPQPPEAERIQFLWRYECLWVMLWALGHVETLGLPTAVCDVRHAVKTVTGTPTDVFIGKSRLRPESEILEEADFIYRCRWVVNESQLNNEPAPAGMDPGVVIERHIALKWLRCFHSENWDDVCANTQYTCQ